MGQKITPNLWFEGNAKEAANFYVTLFPGSRARMDRYQTDIVSQKYIFNKKFSSIQVTGL